MEGCAVSAGRSPGKSQGAGQRSWAAGSSDPPGPSPQPQHVVLAMLEGFR